MHRHNYLDEADEAIILFEAGKSTAKEIAGLLDVSVDTIYIFAKKKKINLRVARPVKNYIPRPVKVKEEPVPFERPKAIYNNIPSGYGIWDQMRQIS